MLDWLSLFASSSQSSPFSGFQSPASQVVNSQLGMSGAMQKPGRAGPAGASDPKVEMVLASAAGPTITTSGSHGSVPGTDKAVHSALGTFRTVYRAGVGKSHLTPMPGGHPTTQDTEVGICHTSPMHGGQTPIHDIDDGIYHMAPMPGSQPLIPSCGFIRSTGKEMPGAPGTFGSRHGSGVGDSHPPLMPSSYPTTQDMEVSVCHTALIPDGQTPLQDVEAGV
ncbi:hypothetical protein E2C01_052476 [Portunus trituberculatus]|uniref:Uncharacterized protein n=1 Tax=Portunus trituberculatus TaxID=210409 RepID=A0A5B7GEM4_PORTR|nr:hypothetical protein [Portunus trituberculatus]